MNKYNDKGPEDLFSTEKDESVIKDKQKDKLFVKFIIFLMAVLTVFYYRLDILSMLKRVSIANTYNQQIYTPSQNTSQINITSSDIANNSGTLNQPVKRKNIRNNKSTSGAFIVTSSRLTTRDDLIQEDKITTTVQKHVAINESEIIRIGELAWKTKDEKGIYTYNEAISICTEPYELPSLLDYNISIRDSGGTKLFIEQLKLKVLNVNPSVPNGYWTSTNLGGGSTLAYYLGGSDLTYVNSSKSSKQNVRCVLK